jgi:signal transduction histidine kinase
MHRMTRKTWPLRLWLVLALIVIVGAPALTTWALTTATETGPPAGELTKLAAVRRILDSDTAAWRDPVWQRSARKQLAALKVDVLLDDMTGRQMFATPGAQALLAWWNSPAGHVTLDRPALPVPGAGRTPPPLRLLTMQTLYTTASPTGPRPGSSRRTGAAAEPVGTAAIWLPPFTPAPSPPPWLVPLAGLLALLGSLAVVAWGLDRLVLQPLAAMSTAADRIAGGDLDVRLPASGAKEVAEVSAALSGMSGALRSALRRQVALEDERRLFIGAIAHDLNTPLFVLRGYLQGLENRVVTSPEKVAAYIAECRSRVDALGRLIGDLFAFTKVEYLEQSLHREPLDPRALLRRAVDGFRPLAAEKGIDLALDGPEAPCPIAGDAHLLTRAVENLLENALRHTAAGGVIQVSWGIEGGQCAICVADSGPGIAAQDLPHLFTPLYRGEASRNRQTGGAGLGLAIARRILRAHGGDLAAGNRSGGGALFTATLPLGRDASETTEPAVAASAG